MELLEIDKVDRRQSIYRSGKIVRIPLGKPILVKQTYDTCWPFGPAIRDLASYINKKEVPEGANCVAKLKDVEEKSEGESGYVISLAQFYREIKQPIVGQLKSLKPCDYIEASNLYYKVLGVQDDGLVLSNTFLYGHKAKGKWFCSFYSNSARIDWNNWSIIRKNLKGAKGIEKKVN